MKKLITIIVCLLVLAGCFGGYVGFKKANLKKEIFAIVDKYLDNAAAGNWAEVFGTLTGEALDGAKANVKSAHAGEKILSRKLALALVSKTLATVTADITKKTAGGVDDRAAYTFHLYKTENGWKIYKTEWGEYLHGALNPGQIQEGAAGVIKAYFEIPYSDKKAKESEYLAGRLLHESEMAGALPTDSKAYAELQKTKTTVQSMECLGQTDGFATVKVMCEIANESAKRPAQFLVDVVAVNGTWKISAVDAL